VEAPSGERLWGKCWHGVLCRLKAVWSIPERFKVVCIPCKALYKCSALLRMKVHTFVHLHKSSVSTCSYYTGTDMADIWLCSIYYQTLISYFRFNSSCKYLKYFTSSEFLLLTTTLFKYYVKIPIQARDILYKIASQKRARNVSYLRSNTAFLNIFEIFDIKALLHSSNAENRFQFQFGEHKYLEYRPKNK